MTDVAPDDLATFLAEHAPFDALDADGQRSLADAARVEDVARGALIVDAFSEPTTEVFVVVKGTVDLWNVADAPANAPDERVGPGGVFGFSAMLTERSVGPRAMALTPVTVARIPASAVLPAFSSRGGARFLADHLSAAHRRSAEPPSYGVVDELIVSDPVTVEPRTPVADVARLMTERGSGYAAVPLGDGRFGLITDAVLRERILVDGLPPSTPAEQVMEQPAPTTRLGDSAAEALILMLDGSAGRLLVTDRAGTLRGVVEPLDFVVSPTTAGVSLREQLRRACSLDELVDRAARMPAMVAELLARGLASGKVIAVHSATVDAIVRRALALVLAQHDDLSIDAFTWLSLGSNGRREAVPSSDVDSAAAFDDAVTDAEKTRYRAAFAEVDDVLVRAGLNIDSHGATAQRAPFARTNAEWRAAGQQWLAAPEENQGAIMTSLLVDGRPIHGDPGLPAVATVFGDLRRHPGTMRLLLRESLSHRAKLRSMRDVLARRGGTFDIKAHALVPVINIARWAALSVGSAELSTTERLREAAGSAMLPDDAAGTLVEVFEVLQRLRLRYQLAQQRDGARPTDVLTTSHVSPIDRSVIAQAVREISSVQRRMDTVAQYVPTDSWTEPDQS